MKFPLRRLSIESLRAAFFASLLVGSIAGLWALLGELGLSQSQTYRDFSLAAFTLLFLLASPLSLITQPHRWAYTSEKFAFLSILALIFVNTALLLFAAKVLRWKRGKI